MIEFLFTFAAGVSVTAYLAWDLLYEKTLMASIKGWNDGYADGCVQGRRECESEHGGRPAPIRIERYPG